jgi:nitrite reductase/ring-hydroxylating ferredoxin subunit
MPDRNDERAAERLDRLVADVLAGRHLKATPSDAADRQAIQLAARLAGTRDGYPRMSPAFRRRLAGVLEKGQAPSWLNRRAALVAGLGLAVGAMGGVVAEEVSRIGHVRDRAVQQAARKPPSTRGIIDPLPQVARWVDTGVVFSEMPDGVPRRVVAGSIGAFVIRRGDQVVGMSSYCTHMPCELVWQPGKRTLNCPCHNLSFDMDGQSMSEGYGLPALPLVRVRVRNGRVEVLGT